DREGTLWFGTSNGLARYDGRRVQKIVADGLPAGRVRALKVDNAGSLWVGTDSGASRLAEGRFETVAETNGHAITAFAVSGNTLFITSEDGLVFTCSDDGRAIKTSVIGPRDSYLLADSSGAPLRVMSVGVLGDRLYLGTEGRGLLSVKGKDVTEVKSKPRQYFVTAIAIDANGKPWFGTNRIRQDFGLYDASDPLKPRRVIESGQPLTSISFDQQGQIWAGTDGQGAVLLHSNGEADKVTFEASAGGLRSNHIYAVFVDREGVVWFGTDRGACRYDPHSPHAERISDNPQTNFVRALYKSRDGRQWAGTNRGLFVREAGRVSWKQVAELETRTIYAVVGDPAGRILVGSAGGLFALASGADTFIPIERPGEALPSTDDIRAIEVFQGAVYAARYGAGIDRIDGDSRTPVAEPKEARDRDIISLHSDGDRLWMGTSATGLLWFDGKHIGSEPGLDQLHSTAVLAIDSSQNGLWLATGQGLDLYRDGKLSKVLEGDEVWCVLARDRDNSAWFGTARGLYRTLQSQTDAPALVRLTAEHGLPSDKVFSLFIESDGPTGDIIWAGTNRGIVSYQPSRTAPLLKATRVLGQRVFQGDELVAWLRLDYPQNSMLVEVAATSSRTFPEQFQYSFLVEDFAGHRIRQTISSDPQLLVENLRPGRYRATARAFTIDLVPSEPLVLNFEVASPPFPWSTAALSTLLGLALIALWWGYHQNRRMAQTNLALEAANRQLAAARLQLATETENERRRIARDLHDQTLADLRGLLLTVDQSSADRTGARALEPAAL
ncbi:MAG TPA: LpqB family beta-propeller domain-containing protein, partial [Blastocatellia bacterium]|nr:LpqB family beta-propeller domain-containing protein [Blastocatellia bacterium]